MVFYGLGEKYLCYFKYFLSSIILTENNLCMSMITNNLNKSNKEIGGINFTSREIDVLSCILNNRGNKKIASLLKVSYKTIEVHNKNIMTKIGCNSKDSIIDFIYGCKAYEILQEHYFKKITNIDNEIFLKRQNKTFQAKQQNHKIKYFIFSSIIVLLTLCIIIGLFYTLSSLNKTEIKYDFLLPRSDLLVKRNSLIKQIEHKFKHNKLLIKHVALLGISGSGKTTLARRYMSLQSANIVWEINAKNENTSLNSMTVLAYHFANNDNETNFLNTSMNIKNYNIRKERILRFIQKKLKQNSNWLLLFDNVENFQSIQTFLPNNPQIWGQGKVIITSSKNFNLNNSYIGSHNVINVTTIPYNVRKEFFLNISGRKMNDVQLQEVLAAIPPYLLDVYIAGKYFHNYSSDIKQYTKLIQHDTQKFKKFQQTYLSDTLTNSQDYTHKTRYNSIYSMILNVSQYSEDAKKLIFLISLLNNKTVNHNIIKVKSLQKLFSSISTGNFNKAIDDLHDNGLIYKKHHTISVHNTILNVMHRYINQKHNSNENIEKVLTYFKNYKDKLKRHHNYYRMQRTQFLLENMLNHIKNNEYSNAVIEKSLTLIIENLDDLSLPHKAAAYCAKLLKLQKTMYHDNNEIVLNTYMYLGKLYRHSMQEDKSIATIKSAITRAQIHNNTNDEIIAQLNLELARTFLSIQKPDKASIYLHKALANKDTLDQKTVYEIQFAHAKLLLRLKKYPEAYKLFIQLAECYNKIKDYNGSFYCFYCAGHALRKMSLFKKAESYCDKAQKICIENGCNDKQYMLLLLARAINNLYLNDYYKGTDYLHKAINLVKNKEWVYGINMLLSNTILSDLFINTGDIRSAIEFHQRCIEIIQKHHTGKNHLLLLHKKKLSKILCSAKIKP